jgi:hypothetical protein
MITPQNQTNRTSQWSNCSRPTQKPPTPIPTKSKPTLPWVPRSQKRSKPKNLGSCSMRIADTPLCNLNQGHPVSPFTPRRRTAGC